MPVLYVCENNQWQAFVHRRETMRIDAIADRAAGYGIEGATVDGNDVAAVHAAASKARAHILRTGQPYLLELVTYRLRGHFEPDDQSYVDAGELAAWRRSDPVAQLKSLLLAELHLTADDLAAIEARVAERIADAIAFAEMSPVPARDELTTHVYA